MADLSQRTRRGASFGVPEVRDAIRTGLGFAVAGLLFLFVADMWIGTCTGSLAQAAGCGVPQKAMLALGSPALMLIGGVWSLMRAFRVKHGQPAWWAWQGAGWALLVLTVICAVLSLPSLPGR
ncbi:hypothetical protein PDG61_27440 [Mycolicibacterium sp. BiH015]|uniref:hypothetical protein n=1 Tax=Mycolicibacterium sp. BiH015 TaxID=3018808 RepID=UPI0022DF1773|nr:hypothetical protein [Mycolicibacterium sp. BiH015]MDA2894673.1 hypothetical protein [Mycolicibacterium sp. BiH015]